MLIQSLSDYRRAVRHGPYAWPGGYPVYFLCEDGESLCFECGAKTNRREILEAIIAVRDCPSARRNYAQWNVVGLDVNWEDNELTCVHCDAIIPSAYGE